MCVYGDSSRGRRFTVPFLQRGAMGCAAKNLHVVSIYVCFFFFSSRRRHTRCSRDWSSDVCSSDLPEEAIVMSRQLEIASYSRRGSLWHKQDLLVPFAQLKTRTDYLRRNYVR